MKGAHPHSWVPHAVLNSVLCSWGVGVGASAQGQAQPLPPRTSLLPPRKKQWNASWTVLEGGVLTFFKDSKTSAAGSLVRPRPPGQGSPHLLMTPAVVF